MSELNQSNKTPWYNLTIREMEENRDYKDAWLKLSQIFGEQMKQEELKLMDGILESIKRNDIE